ncbi:DUF6090 family protein [Ichthyenterobacterium sp. W332]|uniref:DUF6090 family protein n=1 Tax=Microcosmobacter mediterraneus TaxID=3075607 RepID=A0ABU2YI41_9FLAO|nr:DUF6090 family protein [Ichthyenterobacterium sp. W332]MDT0557841.1 DUF6090 family protein [Ichthyenterobacterium sp. W332]
MIKFFRRIRQNLIMENKTSKYFKYAIGEILLVVIGILIALQINNWNENRKLKLNEKYIIENLIEDLQSDYNNYETNKRGLEDQLKLVDQLIEVPANKIIDKTSYLHQLRWGGNIVSIAFEENISKEIVNKDIQEAIKIYYRNQKTTITEATVYWEVVRDLVRPFLRKHGIHNSKSVKELNYYADDIDIELLIEEKLTAHYGSEEFEQILFELRLKGGGLINLLDKLSKSNRELTNVLKAYTND